MKVVRVLAASLSLAGILWALASQRVDTQPTIAPPPPLSIAAEFASRSAPSADALFVHGSVTEAGRLLQEPGILESRLSLGNGAGVSDRERALGRIRELLAKTSERDIIDAVSDLTALEAEDFDDIRDVRKHVLRLAEIATGETVPRGAGVTPVIFARSVAPNGQAVLEGAAFHDQSRAIYAVFPTNPPASDAVYVKWQSIGSSEPLHFDRYPIESSSEQNYVWLEPGDGWSEGTYQVEIFRANDEVTPMATGRFEIVPFAQFTPSGDGHAKKIAALNTVN